MEKKRGVSPIIATVLLVGMVIAIALIVFLWMRAFTQEAITKFDGENIQLSCGRVEFVASYSDNKISISNTGQVPIFDMRVKEITPAGYETKSIKDYGDDWDIYGLSPAGAVSVSASGISGDITLTPVLLGDTRDGRRTFVCEEREYQL